jgi:hypothetical protein
LLVNSLKMIIFVLIFQVTVSSGAQQVLPVFTDVTRDVGIKFKHSYGDFDLSNIVEGTGAGAMFLDYNGDGWLDIYFVNGSWLKTVNDNRGRSFRGKLSNSLYRNNKDGTFSDVTEKAGVGDKSFGFGCSSADFDSDGDLDLYVLNYGPNVFYRNNGDGTFTDISESSKLDNSSWSLSAPWFDYDGDGDLDVYFTNMTAANFALTTRRQVTRDHLATGDSPIRSIVTTAMILLPMSQKKQEFSNRMVAV